MVILILFQAILVWAAVFWIYHLAARRDRRPPIDDLGFFWVFVFAIYTTFPPISWMMQGCTYDQFSGRLFYLQPDPAEVVYLLNISLAYIGSFLVSYGFYIKRIPSPNTAKPPRVDSAKLTAAIVVIGISILLGLAIGGMGVFRPAESYTDSYKVISELPLSLRQGIKAIAGITSVATLVFLVALLQRWPRYSFLFIVYLVSILVSINPEGSRTGTAVGLLSIVIAWHVTVHPIPARRLFFAGLLGLMAFSLLGIWRGTGTITGINNIGLALISGGGEFDALWGNALELLQASRTESINIPYLTRFGEFFSFIPSQFLWFEKTSLATWYLASFHPVYQEAGGGLAFGAISQAVVGGGIPEAAIRGLALGGILGWIMRWIRGSSRNWWKVPFHVYMIVWMYQGVRSTTFSLWGGMLQVVVPSLLLIAVLGSLLSSHRKTVSPFDREMRES